MRGTQASGRPAAKRPATSVSRGQREQVAAVITRTVVPTTGRHVSSAANGCNGATKLVAKGAIKNKSRAVGDEAPKKKKAKKRKKSDDDEWVPS